MAHSRHDVFFSELTFSAHIGVQCTYFFFRISSSSGMLVRSDRDVFSEIHLLRVCWRAAGAIFFHNFIFLGHVGAHCQKCDASRVSIFSQKFTVGRDFGA